MSEARRPPGALDTDYGVQPDGDPRRPAGTSQPMHADGQRSMAEMVGGVVENVQNIVRSEVQLAKAEMREEAKTAGKAAGMLATGAALGLYALGLFLVTVVLLLATQMADWLAALIVTVVVGAIAAVLALKGKSQMQDVHPMPQQTIESVKEDVEWVKHQTR